MTLVDAVVVCGRCGGPASASAVSCPACRGGIPGELLPIVRVSPLSTGATNASPTRRAASCAVSVAVPVLAGTAAALAASLTTPWRVTLGVAVFLALAALQFATWLWWGRALGNVLTSTRTVRADDGTALSSGGIRRLFRGGEAVLAAPGVQQGPLLRRIGAATVSVRGDRDPLRLGAVERVELPSRPTGGARRHGRLRPLMLVFDDRLRVPLERSIVLGRNPERPESEPDTIVLALPDMSRSISKAHVRIDREAERVFVQDLGSTNGTELVAHDRLSELSAGSRVELPPGAHLLLAGHRLRIEGWEEGSAA
ncbi:FHA domain-containing protein [Micromonospora sp. DT81.3]|uniref:FHA domain-containing protein n=1 Tax=Micromonospora sp. DT81.3 TaxID=3416523 RepID=UPI003CFB4FDD